MRFRVHRDVFPLTSPCLQSVVRGRGVDAVEEGGGDQGCDEGGAGEEEGEGGGEEGVCLDL